MIIYGNSFKGLPFFLFLMMDINRANDIAKKVLSLGNKSITNDEREYAEQVFVKLNGYPFRGCGNCWNDLFVLTKIELKKNIKIINSNKMEQQFKLKPGVIIQTHGFDIIGEAEMTDDKAIALLRLSKGHIRSFISYPENWQDIVSGVAHIQNNKPEAAMIQEPQATVWNDEFIKDREANISKDELINASDYVSHDFELMSKRELKEYCESKGYVEKEFAKLGRDGLLKYISSKK